MTPAPSVQALCYIDRIGHSEIVDFLIDTGASGTCLNGTYAYGLHDQMRPHSIRSSVGIGTCDYYHEHAVIIFLDRDNQPIYFEIGLGIQRLDHDPDEDHDLNIPSLLGRDIINKCEFYYLPLENRAYFTIK